MTQADPSASATHGFIVAPLDGPPTGGTLYNARLIEALRMAGSNCQIWTLEQADALSESHAEQFWVDSLYLDSLPELRRQLPRARLGLLLHYLPSLVRIGRLLHRDELTSGERAALRAVDAVVVTSPFMVQQLAALGYAAARVRCVEPGISELAAHAIPIAPSTTVRAAMLCSVVAAKGVLPFLEALANLVREDDQFLIRIAGNLESEPEYVKECRSLIVGRAQLNERVALLGPLPHQEALLLLRDSTLLLSASRMESYGMALAEARAFGVPIIAQDGGHARAHIDAAAGSILVKSPREVARAFLGLVRAQDTLEARQKAAAERRYARSWATAASEFLSVGESGDRP